VFCFVLFCFVLFCFYFALLDGFMAIERVAFAVGLMLKVGRETIQPYLGLGVGSASADRLGRLQSLLVFLLSSYIISIQQYYVYSCPNALHHTGPNRFERVMSSRQDIVALGIGLSDVLRLTLWSRRCVERASFLICCRASASPRLEVMHPFKRVAKEAGLKKCTHGSVP
jgi:hypothetical protein